MQGNGDALQTLFLMNPAYVGYSDNQHQLPPPPSATNFILHGGGGGGGSIPGFNYNLYNPQVNTREVTRAKQGLSLSLSSEQPSGAAAPEEVRVFGGAPENVGLSCKYLKVAQQLLDEVVSIGKEANSGRGLSKEENGQPKNAGGESSAAEESGDGGAKRGAELSTAEKQEIQMKKVKLVDMLNEVNIVYNFLSYILLLVFLLLALKLFKFFNTCVN